MTPLRLLLATAAATIAVAAGAPNALAATLTNSGGTLTYSGADVVNSITFSQTGPNEVQVVRTTTADSDPITGPTGCTQNSAGEDYTCNGVTRVVANGNGGGDVLEASGLTDIPITLNGGADGDSLDGGGATDTVNGDDGADGVGGGGGDDAVSGGSGDDSLDGDAGVDTLDGGDGTDLLEGGSENDMLNAGPGGDRLLGEAGEDTLNAGDGEDVLFGDGGNDLLRGDGGDDVLVGDDGNDDVAGGSGYDTATGPVTGTPPPDIVVMLDDVANDRLSGASGEADNVHLDVEGIDAEFQSFSPLPPSANDTLIGSGAPNSISGGSGNDTVEGGTNNDVLSGGDGEDTIRARDGYADFVSCGAGADTAEVDTLDTVEECEAVNSAEVGNANEDRPPTVQLDAPTAGALLPTAAPTAMTATATDDRGVLHVLFLDDDRIVCTDPAPPYTCDYSPRGEDVGRNTLVAIAVDTSQQTASVTRTFRVDRFTPTITGRVTPARDRRAPFRFRTRGRLRLPAAVPAALGCADGVVSIQVKAGGKTISTRRAGIQRNCAFSSAVTFISRRRFTRTGRLRFTIRFTGNDVLKRSVAVARNVRTRR